MGKVWLLVVIAAVALTAAQDATSARPTITVRVDDNRITSPARWPAGYVDVHIVTAGKVRHHLAFWHLNPGVTLKQFITALHSPNGPFQLGTAVGGNGPMLPGASTRPCISLPAPSSLPTSSTGRSPGPRASGWPALPSPPSRRRPSERSSTAAFASSCPRISGGRASTASQTATRSHTTGCSIGSARGRPQPASSAGSAWREEPPPIDFSRPLGGPGVIGAHWTSWFTLPRPRTSHYILGCFLPDDRGVLHAAMGMVAGFELP